MSNPLTEPQIQVGSFSFMMMVQSEQADPKYNYIHITCRACVKIPLYLDGINSGIENKCGTPIMIFYLSERICTMG